MRAIAWSVALTGAVLCGCGGQDSSIPADSSLVPAPAYAEAVGYTVHTFSTNFTASTVDTADTEKSGFSWYPWRLFGEHANTGAIALNDDGSVTLSGDTTGPNGELITVSPANNADGFVGTAFGGGAYIEAVFKFNPTDVAAGSAGEWPAFWSLSLEGLQGSAYQDASQWPGQAVGYEHNIEADFFEYLFAQSGDPQNVYGASLHDIYGIPGVTCPPGLCRVDSALGKIVAPVGTDFTQYHRYGFLWVPATATKSGYAAIYLDGQLAAPPQEWTQYTNQPPTPQGQPWAFGVLDQRRLMLILGTGIGEPMTIQSVNVWQASTANNLRH
jgi:hypothetical protein